MDLDDSYNDSNRAFLQAFLARSHMTFESAKPILAAIFTAHEGHPVSAEDVTQDDFKSLISAANSVLSPLDLTIRSTLHQVTRERIYALVNTTSDSLTQLATSLTPDEISYFKRLLDIMFDGPNNSGKIEGMCIRAIEAVNKAKIPSQRENQNGNTTSAAMTFREAEEALQKMMDEGWLEKSPAHFYSLAPRALIELTGWLVDAYNGGAEDEDDDGNSIAEKIKFCYACKDIITVGQRCSNQGCLCRLHNNCTQNFFQVQRSQRCPLCRTDWDGGSYVGEKAITTSEAYLKGKRRSSHRHPPTANVANGDDD